MDLDRLQLQPDTMGSIDAVGSLFQPLRMGSLSLKHRVIQAPCTRMRSTKESDGIFVPNDLNVEYYSQRASDGGLMLTEATPISRLVSVHSLSIGEITNSSGCWLPGCPWYLHSIPDRGLEKGHRRSTRQGWFDSVSTMACRPSYCAILPRWQSSCFGV